MNTDGLYIVQSQKASLFTLIGICIIKALIGICIILKRDIPIAASSLRAQPK